MSITVYQYPKCGTCQKALKWLNEHGVDYQSVHIVDHPPSKAELLQIIERSELPTKKFFNTSGKKYRELNLKERLPSMSDDEQIELLASDGMLIKRPIATDGKQVTVGFNENSFTEKWI